MIEPDEKLNRLTEAVIGAAIEVHRALGPGFLESTYEEALAIEFEVRGIPFSKQHPVAMHYRERVIGQGRLDFLVADCVIVELKAIDQIASIHKAQVISYLKATNLQVGLLINFNVEVLRDGIRRVVRTETT